MRVPRVLTNCKTAAGVAVILMGSGTIFGSAELRAWALLFGVLAAGLCAAAAVRDGVEAIKSHLTRYVFNVFEDGFRAGVEQGREMEAAERFISAASDRN